MILGGGPLSEAVKTVLLERNARTVQILFPEREVLNRVRNVDLLLNTVGAFGDRKVHLVPLPAERLSIVREVLDLTALEQPSGLLLEAWARDIPAYGGLYMFIEGLRRSAELFLMKIFPKRQRRSCTTDFLRSTIGRRWNRLSWPEEWKSERIKKTGGRSRKDGRGRLFGLCFALFSAQSHIQNHHEGKAQGHADGGDIGVLSLVGLGNQLFHHHIDHGACCKGKKIRQNRRNKGGKCQRQ